MEKITRTEEEWKKTLTPEQFEVMRKRGTEAPFSCGLKMLQNKEPGTYHCVACENPLFSTKDKFESGTGWPSYLSPVTPEAVEYHEDDSHGMVRTEVLCARCESHLGHVFDDGPAPTGKRYCINAVALKFKPEK